MATKNYNSWDLSSGMDVDYSGSKERKLADEEFQRGQKIIANAYEMDSYSATAQSNADKTNATNQSYLNTVGLATQAKNAEYQAYLDTVNGKVSSINSTNALLNATNISNLSDKNAQNEAEDLVRQASGFTTIVNDNAQTTPEPVQQTPIVENPNSDLKNNFNQDTNKKFIVDNNGFVTKNNNYIENIQTNNQDNQLTQTNTSLANKQNNQVALQNQQPRLKTNLEVYEEAYAGATTQKAKFILQNNIRSEYIKQASASSYYDPVNALSMLNKAGITLPIDLRSRGDGTYNQKLPDGSTVNISRIDATLMVSDIINSTNKTLEKDQKQIAEAQSLQKEINKEDRDYQRDLKKLELNERFKIAAGDQEYYYQINRDNNTFNNNIKLNSLKETTNTQPQQSFNNVLTGQSNKIVPDIQRASLIQSESSGDYKNIKSPLGYVGAYQFGTDRLVQLGLVKEEYAGKGNNVLKNPEAWKIEGGLNTFLNNKELQDNTYTQSYETSKNYIIKRLPEKDKNNYRLIAGLVRGAHLAGDNGIMAAYESKWKDNPSDKNKTTYKSYFDEGIKNYDKSNNKLLLPVGTTLPETKVNNNKTQPKTIAINDLESELNLLDKQIPVITKKLDEISKINNKNDNVTFDLFAQKYQELKARKEKLEDLKDNYNKEQVIKINNEVNNKKKQEADNKLKSLLESIK